MKVNYCFFTLCTMVMVCNSGCSLAMLVDRYTLSPAQEEGWAVKIIVLKQCTRPGKLNELGSATMTLELADKRTVVIALPEQYSKPEVAMFTAPVDNGTRQLESKLNWVMVRDHD